MTDFRLTYYHGIPDQGPRWFLDCHSTSSESVPYASSLDRPDCVALAERLPIHCVIGAGDRLQGISDEYLVDRGFTGFTFEAGQHASLSSLEAQQCVIWATLQRIGNIDEVPRPLEARLARTQLDGRRTFYIEHIHHVLPTSGFRMLPGFFNFQRIRPGDLLAYEHDQPIHSEWDARIFMPLYQLLGDEGFSVIVER